MSRAVNGMKQCNKCGEVKTVDEFHKDKNKSDKLSNQCKICVGKYHEKNKEHIHKRKKQHYKENKEQIRERGRQHYKENKEREKQRSKQYREENPNYIKQYYEKNRNREYINIPDEKYCSRCNEIKPASKFGKNKNHPDGLNNWCGNCINKHHNKRSKQRRDSNPMFRLNASISSGMSQSLKGNKQGHHWEDLVCYTLEKLKSHLESQFEDWMNWDNHGTGDGKWHIDHIVPISLFEFENPEDPEFKMCWSLSNLRPLEASKNISKGNKFDGNLSKAKLTLRKHLTSSS